MKEVTCTVKEVLSESKSRNDIIQIRIVQWNNGKPSLEKRELWTDEAGTLKNGKAKGFDATDFELLIQNADKVKALLTQVVTA